jgi:hypothetical protein
VANQSVKSKANVVMVDPIGIIPRSLAAALAGASTSSAMWGRSITRAGGAASTRRRVEPLGGAAATPCRS